jgi:hypothetical protein
MKSTLRKLPVFLAVILLLSGCSHKAMQPEQSIWQSVPCEYRFEGGNQSTLLVRAGVVEFDSAKIVAQIFQWTISGDTLTHQVTYYPYEYQRYEEYTIFTTQRCLPINSSLLSVELLVKK